jgi:hypothetical protein
MKQDLVLLLMMHRNGMQGRAYTPFRPTSHERLLMDDCAGFDPVCRMPAALAGA